MSYVGIIFQPRQITLFSFLFNVSLLSLKVGMSKNVSQWKDTKKMAHGCKFSVLYDWVRHFRIWPIIFAPWVILAHQSWKISEALQQRQDVVSSHVYFKYFLVFWCLPVWLSGERVDSWPGGFELNTWLRRTFFPAYFCLSPLLKHMRKVVGGFGKKGL